MIWPVLVERYLPPLIKFRPQERSESPQDWFEESANFYIARLCKLLHLSAFACLEITCFKIIRFQITWGRFLFGERNIVALYCYLDLLLARFVHLSLENELCKVWNEIFVELALINKFSAVRFVMRSDSLKIWISLILWFMWHLAAIATRIIIICRLKFCILCRQIKTHYTLWNLLLWLYGVKRVCDVAILWFCKDLSYRGKSLEC